MRNGQTVIAWNFRYDPKNRLGDMIENVEGGAIWPPSVRIRVKTGASAPIELWYGNKIEFLLAGRHIASDSQNFFYFTFYTPPGYLKNDPM